MNVKEKKFMMINQKSYIDKLCDNVYIRQTDRQADTQTRTRTQARTNARTQEKDIVATFTIMFGLSFLGKGTK